MKSLSTTRMSSKGQVVIPEEVRKKLGLEEGDQFVVIGSGDSVILKSIHPPSMTEFDALIRKARKQAKDAGLKKSDVTAAIRAVRKEKRSET